MAKGPNMEFKGLVKLIVQEVDRTGIARGSVNCKSYRGQAKDDLPFTWTYSFNGLEAVEGGNDFDEPDPRNMADRALDYLKATVDEIKKLDYESKRTSSNSGTFNFRGPVIAVTNNVQANAQNANPARDLRLANYEEFLLKGKPYHSNQDFSRDAASKRRLLENYFPGRFGVEGSQSISRKGYNDAAIGALFNKVYESARDIVKRINEGG